MRKRIFILMNHDLVHYPPMQSLLRVICELNYDLNFVGTCSDIQTKRIFENQGVNFIELDGRLTGGIIYKLGQQYKVKKRLLKIFRDYGISNNDLLWIDYSYWVHSLQHKIKDLRYIAHFYEFVNENINWKYKVLYPYYDMRAYLQSAKCVVHCEYNRAIITRGLYGLDKMPHILPNKPYFDEEFMEDIPQDILIRLQRIEDKVKDKKIVLYQGAFESRERRLEEFCQAITLLPKEYMLIAMGFGGDYYEFLKKTYESDRVVFVPYVRPPYHLFVTKKAAVGVLTYNPLNSTYAGVLNPLYCAPNKIFEFSRYGIPMVSNDLPGLRYIFDKYKCGITLTYPITANKIAEAILSINKDEKIMRMGARNYYDSVNFKDVVINILEDAFN